MASAENDVTALILRFRDLVTGVGETIRQHRDIIDGGQPVYWGWWHKGGEKVPAELFVRLNRQAQTHPLSVLLFDSGTEQLYKAKLTHIDTSANGEAFATPDRDRTPEYYRDKMFRAWFKFSEIAVSPIEEAQDALTGYSYVRVDELFEAGVSRYDSFYNKRVASLAELKQQDRTIWFVRDAVEGDGTHEIELLAPTSVAPFDFPEAVSNPSVILWISDLHFSADNHNFPMSASSAGGDDLATCLERFVERLGYTQLGAVLITGDLTWRGSDEEFGMVKAFIERVRSRFAITRYQIVLCPGNHDVRFSSDPSDSSSEVTVASDEARRGYDDLYQWLYNKPPNTFGSLGRRFALRQTSPIEIVSLNSSMLQQTEGVFQGHGFIGEDQLDMAASSMGWCEGEATNTLRILMLHHHVLPVTYRETPMRNYSYSVVLDAGAVLRWAARFRIGLILHGHMHQPFIGRVEVPLKSRGRLAEFQEVTIAGLGSTGVSSRHLGQVGRNIVGILSFDLGQVTVRMYPISAEVPAEANLTPLLECSVPCPALR